MTIFMAASPLWLFLIDGHRTAAELDQRRRPFNQPKR